MLQLETAACALTTTEPPPNGSIRQPDWSHALMRDYWRQPDGDGSTDNAA
jgi:hypothetical protein